MYCPADSVMVHTFVKIGNTKNYGLQSLEQKSVLRKGNNKNINLR